MFPDKHIHPDIFRKVKGYWFSERATWVRAGFELDDLLQLARIKLWRVPPDVLKDKGIGYQVRLISNYLNDQLRKLKAQKNSFEEKLLDLLNEETRGKEERGESGVHNISVSETNAGVDLETVKEQAQYLTTSQKLAATGYRIKRIRKPVHLEVIYDINHPRRYHRCFVNGRWLLLDVLANQEGYVSKRADVELVKQRLRQRKECLTLPLTLKGNKQDVTDVPIPRRVTDKDLRQKHREDPVDKGIQQYRKDFFEDFF